MARPTKGQLPKGGGEPFRKKKNGEEVGNYFFKYGGKPINTGTKDLKEARRQQQIYVGKAAEGIAPSRSVKIGTLLDGLVDSYDLGNKRSKATILSRIIPLRAYFGQMDAQTLSVQELKKYRDRRKKGTLLRPGKRGSQVGLSPTGVDRELQALRAALNIGKEDELISRVPSFKNVLSGQDNVRKGYLDPENYILLRDTLREDIRLMFVVACHIGWRAGKILSLRLDQVEFDPNKQAGIIKPPESQADNKTVGIAPIYGDLAREMQTALMVHERDYPDCPWLIHRNGKKVKNYRDEFYKATIALGLGRMVPKTDKEGRPVLDKHGKQKMKYEGLNVHDLRRTAVRDLLNLGIPEGRVMKIVGHKSRSMLDRYDIQDERSTKKLAEELNKKLAEEAFKSSDGAHLERTHGTNGVN